MGKISCEACKKSCKGQAIRLQDKYFHIKCFKCKECSKQLAAGGFYTKDESYYCSEDYQRLFGTRCHGCGKYVEGEVVTALGNTYHQTCFHCTRCNRAFTPGAKVTFSGKDYLCNSCLEQTASSAATTPMVAGSSVPRVSPRKAVPVTSTPARPGQILMDGHMVSPYSDMSDVSTDMKENMSYAANVSPHSHVSGVSTSGYKSDASSDKINFDRSSDDVFVDDYLTPQPTGHHDQDKLSPIQNIMQYRSPTPESTISRVSKKSVESSVSLSSSRHEVDYGKFFKTSYLEKPHGFKKGPSINPPAEPKVNQFHRPANFSYSHVRSDFIKPAKRGMMSALGEKTYVVTKRTEPAVPLLNKEAIQLSKFPDGYKPEDSKPAPIEREDWPAPPAPAAAFPELLRDHPLGKRSKEPEEAAAQSAESGDEERPVDPKIEKEIEVLHQLSESGAAKAVLGELEKKRAESPTLDPHSASRVPAADREPHFKPRYQCPIFASPSRDLAYRARLHSVDDLLAARKYRTTLPISNFPVEMKGRYEVAKGYIPHLRVPKPGYGLSPRAQTLPPAVRTGLEGRGGYVSDIEPHTYRRNFDSDFEDADRRSAYTSQSSLEEYDPHTGLRRGARLRSSLASENFSTPTYRHFRRSIPSLLKGGVEEAPKIYPYEQLKLSNKKLPPDVDINNLELHLGPEDFEATFHMSRDDFYRLAEWKRNDLKKRVDLFV